MNVDVCLCMLIVCVIEREGVLASLSLFLCIDVLSSTGLILRWSRDICDLQGPCASSIDVGVWDEEDEEDDKDKNDKAVYSVLVPPQTFHCTRWSCQESNGS